MKTKQLISSYDEINDIFVGKIANKNGYIANYGIGNGIFLNTDKNNFPASVYVDEASKVLNVSKEVLENPDVIIFIGCDESEIDFELFVDNKRIYASKSRNIFNIPNVSCILDANY